MLNLNLDLNCHLSIHIFINLHIANYLSEVLELNSIKYVIAMTNANNSKKAVATRKRVQKHRAKKQNRQKYEKKVQDFMQKNCENTLNSGEEMSYETENEKQSDFGIEEKLRNWAIKHRITKSAINDLLGILIFFGFNFLPKDSRSLMKTPIEVDIKPLSSGKIWFNGIRKTLSKALSRCNVSLTITLDFNFDGMPLFNSSTLQFWPILYSIRGKFCTV